MGKRIMRVSLDLASEVVRGEAAIGKIRSTTAPADMRVVQALMPKTPHELALVVESEAWEGDVEEEIAPTYSTYTTKELNPEQVKGEGWRDIAE
jgi:hypothetical protein